MADLVSDGKTRIAWVAVIANKAAPTVAELNAGVLLHQWTTPDGLNTEPSTAGVDTSAISSTYGTQKAGRRGFEIALTLKRQQPVDTPWNLLPYGTLGFLVVRRNVDANAAWAAGQSVEVYPSETGEPKQAPPAENSLQRFTSNMFMTDTPETRAVVAA